MFLYKRKNIFGKLEGFTLIELVVVMAIIALLAALIIGAIAITRQQADVTRLRSDAHNIQTALEGYFAKNRHFPPDYRVDAYSLYADTSAYYTDGKTYANQDGAHPLSTMGASSWPTPPANNGSKGLICYSAGLNAQDYWFWILTPGEVQAGKVCIAPSCTNSTCGFIAADPGSKIHCPNGTTSSGCSSQYWY